MLDVGVIVLASNIFVGVVPIFVGDPFMLRDNFLVSFDGHVVVFGDSVGGILVVSFSVCVVTFAVSIGDVFIDSFNDRVVTFGGSAGGQVFKTGMIG